MQNFSHKHGCKIQKINCAARESNPGRKNGNLAWYHYTSGAHIEMRAYTYINKYLGTVQSKEKGINLMWASKCVQKHYFMKIRWSYKLITIIKKILPTPRGRTCYETLQYHEATHSDLVRGHWRYVEFSWVQLFCCFTSHSTLFHLYVTAHRCAGGM